MAKIYKSDEEISPKEMVKYGLDHLGSGATLFKGNPEHYDSAGYLIHIGYECILKGWWLEQDQEIQDGHDLIKICNRIKEFQFNELPSEAQDTIKLINTFRLLRYPNLINPIEISTEMLDPILHLIKFTLSAMPKEIRPKQQEEFIVKGNRKLYKKPIIPAKKKVASK